MKSQQLLLLSVLLLHLSSSAQLSTNTDGFYIAANTNTIIDSLVVIPTVSLNITNTNITRTGVPVTAATGNSIARVHNFSQPLSVTGTMGLYFLNSELNGNTAASLAFVYRTSPNNIYVTSTNSTLDLPNSYISQILTGGTITRVTATNQGVTLPILLSSYTAIAEGSRAKIEWTVAFEQHTDYYQVERSADGVDFTVLTNAPSKNLSSAYTYAVYDDHPSNGRNYYRLTQYDADGSSKLMGIREIDFTKGRLLSVLAYPNPVTDNLNVKIENYTGRKVSISLFDIHGKLVHKETIIISGAQSVYPLRLSSKLASGQYTLQVSGDGRLNEALKITVR